VYELYRRKILGCRCVVVYELSWRNVLYHGGFIVMYSMHGLPFVQTDTIFSRYKTISHLLWWFKCRIMRG
jgi:hypothetical protein